MTTMFGPLTGEEIEVLLHEQWIGRIGGNTDGRPYVVPVNYAYDGRYAYGYSPEGRKLQMLRQTPLVCFEVDDVKSPTDWRSAIAYGVFEELHDEAAYAALELLSARLRAGGVSEALASRSFVTRRGAYGLAYRIALLEKTGRFERADTSFVAPL
jgi:hypothetical protein